MNQCNPPPIVADAIIPISRAREMYNEYGSYRRTGLIELHENNIAGHTNFKATRYAEFRYEKLKAYMAHLECIDQKLKSNRKQGINHVRIFFANYPSAFSDGTEIKTETYTNDQGDPVEVSYAGKNTVILAPTTNIDNTDQCFQYQENGTGINVADFNTNSAGYSSLILDEAGLTPPPPKPPDYFGQ